MYVHSRLTIGECRAYMMHRETTVPMRVILSSMSAIDLVLVINPLRDSLAEVSIPFQNIPLCSPNETPSWPIRIRNYSAPFRSVLLLTIVHLPISCKFSLKGRTPQSQWGYGKRSTESLKIVQSQRQRSYTCTSIGDQSKRTARIADISCLSL